MVKDKNLTRLSLDYQDYLTYISINLTVAVSVFIAFFSYVLTQWSTLTKEPYQIIILLLIVMSIEIIFLSVHSWLIGKKRDVRNKIKAD